MITDKTPREYNEKDYERHKVLLLETNVFYQHYNPLSNRPRASKSRKWNAILAPIWDEFHQDYEDGDTESTISEYHSAGDQSVKEGERILYHSIKGCRIYLQKNGYGMHLSPRPLLAGIRGDGLYLRMGSSVYDGKGLLLGPRSPFRNITILKWILWTNTRAIYLHQRKQHCKYTNETD